MNDYVTKSLHASICSWLCVFSLSVILGVGGVFMIVQYYLICSPGFWTFWIFESRVVMHVLRITFRVGFVFSTFLDKLAKTWFLFCTRTYLELLLSSWNYTEHWLEKFWGRGDTCILKLECSLPEQFVFGALLPESWICVYCFRNWFFVGKR